MRIRDILESATGMSSADVGTIPNPHISPGPARGTTGYLGKPGQSGTKSPPQPKVKQKKNKDGTAKNALDQNISLFGKGTAVRR